MSLARIRLIFFFDVTENTYFFQMKYDWQKVNDKIEFKIGDENRKYDINNN